MDPLLNVPKNLPKNKDDLSSPGNPTFPEDQISSNLDPEELRSTSAPLKTYSGSLFLYSNDPFGEYFTTEGQDLRDEHYNKFFDLKPQKNEIPLNEIGSYQNKPIRNNSDSTDLHVREMLNRNSIVDPRLSPDLSANHDIMEAFKESSPISNPKQSFPVMAREGDTKHTQRNKSKSYHSPKKPNEIQGYPSQMMYPPMMINQSQQFMSVNMGMNMMQPDYNYMMNARMTEMMGYSVPVMNYNPYGVYQPGMMQVPPGFGTPFMPPMEPTQSFPPQQSWPQESYQNNNSHGNNNVNSKRRSNSNAENNNKFHHKNDNQKNNNNNNKDKERNRDFQQHGGQQKKDRKRENNNNNNNTNSNTSQGANIQSLSQGDQEHLIDDALSLAKDQSGCRLLQQKLELNNPEITNKIFDKVIEKFDTLMTDPFGNYLCQKIAEICTNEQTKKIIEVVSPSIIDICLNPHGTRAVQKLIEIVKSDELVQMLSKSLSSDVVGLVKDNHGNHVIQKCLTNMSETNRQFIYDSITESCVEVSTHKHGCCVMQRCLDHASKKQKNDLVRVIANNTLGLVEDQYGNYVVQYILEMKDKESDINEIVGNSLIGHVPKFSKQKFSSNVIEKCLQLNIPDFRQHFMEVLCIDEILVDLICDQFGNYVIQRCLTNGDEQLKDHILEAINQNAQAINKDSFGNKIYTKLSKNYPQLEDVDSANKRQNSPHRAEENVSNNNNRKGSNTRGGGKQTNKNMERKNGNQGGMTKNSRRNTEQNSHNPNQNMYQRNHHRHSVGSKNPHAQPIRNDMMVAQNMNMGNPMMQPMQPGYFMAQPQPYGQFYGYPQMQPDINYNNDSWQ